MDITEFVEYLDEIVDYDKIQKEYGMTYSEVKAHIDSLKPPNDLPTWLRALADNHMEQIAAEVHNQWWREKERQGFHSPKNCLNSLCEKCHPDMYPYEALPEYVKEYDRVTVRGVLSAIEQIAAELEKEGE